MLHQAGLLAQPLFRLPACAVAYFGNGSAWGGMVFTATGIAPGWKNYRTSLLMIPCGGINRNA
ncbi:MAG: hypothetical protein RLZZ420_31 [Bacteroidota bacterium]|jgi:hypothetical protein